MLGDRWEAEDAVQESITKAWRKLDQAREPTQFRAWFLAIVANQCRNVRRTRWFRTLRVRELRVAPSDPHPDHVDLERALDHLPPKDRQAIFLYFYLDLPVEEVATVLGISAAAACPIAITHDGGKNWFDAGPQGAAFVGFNFADPSDGWAVDSSHYIWMTQDGGQSWFEAGRAPMLL